ncbi:MAG: rod shape-determining protein MreD [Anaerolineae bacterium]|nr:rod shape-determining protein MreD [Anaerolineae bacterium]
MIEPRDSRWRHAVAGVLVLGSLAFLQGSGALRLGEARIGPDLVLCAVLSWAFLNGAGAGAVWGFVGGLILDGLSAGPFGVGCFALTLVGTLAGLGRFGLYADDVVWVTAVGALGSMAFYAIMLLAGRVEGASVPFVPALVRVVLPAVLLDIVCVLAWVSVLRRSHRRLAGRYQV